MQPNLNGWIPAAVMSLVAKEMPLAIYAVQNYIATAGTSDEQERERERGREVAEGNKAENARGKKKRPRMLNSALARARPHS